MKFILWAYINIIVKIYIELDIVQKSLQTLHCTGDKDQDHPHGKVMQKSKMAVWGGLTNSCEKKRGESKGKKRTDKSI